MPLSNQLSDFELVALAKEGDEAAFAQLYNRYWAVLFLHARRMIADDEEAKDLVQTFFYKLLVNLSHFTFETSFSSYVYRAVRNMVLDHMKHQGVIRKYLASFQDFVAAGAPITDQEIRRRELERLIEEEVSALPAKMQEIFRLSRMEQLTHKEIGKKLNISEHTVKSQISNALRILRSRLGSGMLLFLLNHSDF
ncbi:RNA polymerase sigma factor [Sphingobacterium griseoflavum]|uniref:RNA polymerase sigma-70 factor n=1 Tax=Sphingobacterium griseoflavum TaxID=1474952 RepID=A0ABQ3HWD7_9SPHI|nr:RNA polymerase sigma-70 factor [Sphingobacterium griseoflavum]GHE32782.1 RNA polymerase sigma-70 factor [Sphingobacterium griseoflavum]